MPKLGLWVAMEGEAAALIAAFGLKPRALPAPLTRYPFRWFEGDYRGLTVRLAIAGRDTRDGIDLIGLEPAAVGAFALIQDFSPDLLVNAGTCGSFASKGAAIARVYLSATEFYFHDHRIPLGAFEPYGYGAIPAHDASALAKELGLGVGAISSGSSLDYTERDLEVFHQNGATLKEMEGAAIARVCQWSGTPFFAVKSVTNLLDSGKPSPEEFTRNFARAVEALTAQTIRVVDSLAAQPRLC